MLPTEKPNLRSASQLVTAKCFNQGLSPKFAWIPAKSMRE
jgi:hypothetical protein